MKYARRAVFMASAATIMVNLTSVAYAQSAGSDLSGDIIVTAQKREQSANDVGLSITTLGKDELERRRITDPYELANVVPSLSVANVGNAATSSYTLRGIGFNSSALGAAPTVSVYVDQVSLPYPAMTQGAYLDLERVEVYKGPQGTLYGQNATAGAINFIAAKPTDTLTASLSGTYGRFNQWNASGFVSGPLGDGIKARLAVSHDGGGDWQKSYTRRASIGSRNRSAGRLLIDADLSPSLHATLGLSGWRDKSDTQAVQLVRVTPSTPANVLPGVLNYPVAPHNARAADWNDNSGLVRGCETAFPNICRGVGPSYDTTFWQPSLRLDLELDDKFTVTSLSSYADYRTKSYFDNDGTTFRVGESDYFGDVGAFSQELRLNGKLDKLNLTVGVNYGKDRVDNDLGQDTRHASQTQNIAGFSLFFSPVTITQRTESKAVFGNAEFEFSDQLTVIGGLRYTDTKTKFHGCNRDDGYEPIPNSPVPGITEDGAGVFNTLYQIFSGNAGVSPVTTGACFTLNNVDGSFNPTDVRDTLKENNLSWNVTVNFKPTSNTLLYGLVSKGYKSGSFPNFGASTTIQYLPVKQESVLAYEAGYKLTMFDRTLQVDGALFYYNYRNKQLSGYILDPIFGPLQSLVNIPKSDIKGAEIQATLRPIAGLSLGGGLTYIDTEIKRFIGTDALGATRDFAGARLNLSPKWFGNANARYEWPVSSKMDALLGVDLTYRSSTAGTISAVGAVNPDFNMTGYALVDVSAGIQEAGGQGWKILFWSKNVTNKYYWNNVTRTSDNIVRLAGMPVTYGVTVGMKF